MKRKGRKKVVTGKIAGKWEEDKMHANAKMVLGVDFASRVEWGQNFIL